MLIAVLLFLILLDVLRWLSAEIEAVLRTSDVRSQPLRDSVVSCCHFRRQRPVQLDALHLPD